MRHFDYSTSRELGGDVSCCRLCSLIMLTAITLILPVIAVLDHLGLTQYQLSVYAWLVYVLVLNSVILLWLPKYLASSVAYPYSNSFVNYNQRRQTNQRFGMQFRRCVERMTRMISETYEHQNHDHSSNIITGKMGAPALDNSETEQDSETGTLNPKDIYMRIASNLELIQLYTSVNEQLIRDDPRGQTALFRRVTDNLVGIKSTLDQITVKISFRHQWFPEGQPLTYWSFFNRFNLETEKKDQAVNVKKFFLRYQPPLIPQNQTNQDSLQRLAKYSDDFTDCVNLSLQKTCCLFSCQEVLFGRLDQAALILKMTFEGKQFFVDGADGNRIDCMFFPCTQKETVELQEFNTVIRESSDLQPRKEYMQKPTVIMCNPNALYYQQMVIAPNAYWLNFFLKRDINVICWNYRGYGASTIGSFDYASPTKAKLDAERVLGNAYDLLGLQGKIGIYGRSIGGIAACHLAQKYPDVVEALMIDRSMNELKDWIQTRAKGRTTIALYEQFLTGWDCLNSKNFIDASNCFKIITCDPVDDTIDQFVSTMAGIAVHLAREKYDTEEYRLFMESLIYLTEVEDHMYTDNDWGLDDYSVEVLTSVQQIEKELGKKQDQSEQGYACQFDLQLLRSNMRSFRIFYVLVLMVSDLQAATMKLREVIGVTRQPNFKEFSLFWQLAEVFGGGYLDDVDHQKFNLRNDQTHHQSFIVQLKKVIRAYEISLVALRLEQKKQKSDYDAQILSMIHFQLSMFQKLLKVQEDIVAKGESNFKTKVSGHLVQFACGHRGQPSRIEEKRISRLLRKSGFIPMLEDLPPPQPVKQETKNQIAQRQGKPPVGLKPPPSKPSLKQIEPKPMLCIEESPEENQLDLSDMVKQAAAQDSDEEQIKDQSRKLIEQNYDYEDNSADNVTDLKLNEDIQRSMKIAPIFGRFSRAIGEQAEDSYFFGIDRDSSRNSLTNSMAHFMGVSPQVSSNQSSHRRLQSLSNNLDLMGTLLDNPASSSQPNERQQPRGGSLALSSINAIFDRTASDELL